MGIYEELGVKKVINCKGPYTTIGGSLMSEEVIKVMLEASKSFVSIEELLDKTGKKIARLTGAPAAFITSGAAAGLAVSVAACMAGSDPQKAKQLPNTSGMKNKVIVHRCHRIHYDQAVFLTGAHFIEIGFSDWTDSIDMTSYINSETAAILYIAKFENLRGSIPLDAVIKIAFNAKIPVIVDAADEVPPISNLYKYIKMGVNLVIYSGGKGLAGPQGSGLILGDKDLIKACSVNANPNYGIGRPMKVDKEEIVGLTKAVEQYVNKDFELEMQTWKRQQEYIKDKLSGIFGINCIFDKPLPSDVPGSFYLPSLYIDLNEEKLLENKDKIISELWVGDPRIAVAEYQNGIILRMMMIKNGQEKIVLQRLVEIFEKYISNHYQNHEKI